jgi:hypothetical protein
MLWPLLEAKNKEYANVAVVMDLDNIDAAQKKSVFILFYLRCGIDYWIQMFKLKNNPLVDRNSIFETGAFFIENHLEHVKIKKLFLFFKMYRKKHAHGVTF